MKLFYMPATFPATCGPYFVFSTNLASIEIYLAAKNLDTNWGLLFSGVISRIAYGTVQRSKNIVIKNGSVILGIEVRRGSLLE